MSAIGIAELARVLSPSGYRTRNQVFALLSACLDKSSDQPRGITSVAGYVATLDEWQAVEAKWQCGINEWSKLEGFRKLGGFHMAELEHAIGKDNAALCIKHFASIITESRMKAIGAAVLNEDWHKDHWGPDHTTKLGSTYAQCLDLALQVLGKYAARRFPGLGIEIICCNDEKHQCIQSVFNRQQPRFPMFQGVSIRTGHTFMLLQCADLGAGCLRRSWGAIEEKGRDEARELSWGSLPSGVGTAPTTTFWSLRQGAVLSRALTIELSKLEKQKRRS